MSLTSHQTFRQTDRNRVAHLYFSFGGGETSHLYSFLKSYNNEQKSIFHITNLDQIKNVDLWGNRYFDFITQAETVLISYKIEHKSHSTM